MTECTKNWISTPIKGSGKPIVVEFNYEDWRRIERLSNRKDAWLFKFYDTLFVKAGLPTLDDIAKLGLAVSVPDIAAGATTYERIEKIGKEKYGERHWPMISLAHGMSMVIKDSDPPVNKNQIVIRPTAFGSNVWSQDVIDAAQNHIR